LSNRAVHQVSGYSSGEAAEAVEIGLGPAGADEEIANNVWRKGIMGSMIMNYDSPTNKMAIDAQEAEAGLR
jgi:hypothetical protein